MSSNGDGDDKQILKKSHSSFIRCSDLNLEETILLDSEQVEKLKLRSEDLWVALDESCASSAVQLTTELIKFALECIDGHTSAGDKGEEKEVLITWKPEKHTEKLLKECSSQLGEICICDEAPATNNKKQKKCSRCTYVEKLEKEVLIWTGSFGHGKYGSEVPVVKSSGLIHNISAENLAKMLLDSSRVKDYNKMSLGRSDSFVFQQGLETNGNFGTGETKLILSTNKPPLVKKTLQFNSLLHGRKLLNDDGEERGFILVGRSIAKQEDSSSEAKLDPNEILFNVHLIRPWEYDSSKTEMVNINHMKSSMVPRIIANKMGLSSASNFIKNIRECVADDKQ